MTERRQRVNARSSRQSQARLRAKRRKRIQREIREWVVTLTLAILAVIVVRTYVFTLVRVDGSSMMPTLANGERMFVTLYDVRFGDIDRGDIVICYYPNRGRDHFVKRVVGVPGDSVYRQDGVTHVVYTIETSDGIQTIDAPLDPEYAQHPDRRGPDYAPHVLERDEFFVVGDNRYNSHDSRDWNDSDPSYAVGPINRNMITGHVRNVLWPIADMRPVD